jgi:hypothetical protein
VPVTPLGSIKEDGPDGQCPEMGLLVWPQRFDCSTFRLPCRKCFHPWVIEKMMNDHYLDMLVPGATTGHID